MPNLSFSNGLMFIVLDAIAKKGKRKKNDDDGDDDEDGVVLKGKPIDLSYSYPHHNIPLKAGETFNCKGNVQ